MATRGYYLAHKKEYAEYQRRKRAEHPELHAKRQREFRKLNPESSRLACRRYYWKNIERMRARNRVLNRARRYGPHREKLLASDRASKLRNHGKVMERIRERKHRIRALKQGAPVEAKYIARWMAEVKKLPFARCHWCGTKIHGRQIHFDHVVPLSKGGPHTVGNLCASCKDCNLKKGARLISDWLCNGQTFLPL